MVKTTVHPMLAFVGYLLQIGMLKSRRFWMVVDPLTYKVHSMLPTEWYLLEKVGSSTGGPRWYFTH